MFNSDDLILSETKVRKPSIVLATFLRIRLSEPLSNKTRRDASSRKKDPPAIGSKIIFAPQRIIVRLRNSNDFLGLARAHVKASRPRGSRIFLSQGCCSRSHVGGCFLGGRTFPVRVLGEATWRGAASCAARQFRLESFQTSSI